MALGESSLIAANESYKCGEKEAEHDDSSPERDTFISCIVG